VILRTRSVECSSAIAPSPNLFHNFRKVLSEEVSAQLKFPAHDFRAGDDPDFPARIVARYQIGEGNYDMISIFIFGLF